MFMSSPHAGIRCMPVVSFVEMVKTGELGTGFWAYPMSILAFLLMGSSQWDYPDEWPCRPVVWG